MQHGNYVFGMIVRVRVVFVKTVAGDLCFNYMYLSGSASSELTLDFENEYCSGS